MDTNLHSSSRDYDARRTHADIEAAAVNHDEVGSRRRTKNAMIAQSGACSSSWYHDAAIDQANREAIETRCHPYEASR